MNDINDLVIKKALDFARLSLAGKKRQSGEDVAEHCIGVAKNLQRFKVNDPASLSVALLHHSLHEGAATLPDIQSEFSSDIATMLESFEKLRLIKSSGSSNNLFVENLRKMFLVLAKDLRVVFIKMADILDNLKTLEYVDEKKREEVAKKTLEIFAPLAERLGMGELKGQMQDLAFQNLYPQDFEWVKSYAGSRLEGLGKMLLKVKGKVILSLAGAGINAEVQSRVKHVYSLYQKLLRPEIGQDLNKVVDLIALRIIVESIEDCYKALDIVHKLFPPIAGKVSDYITHPKPNGYRSIHTKLLGPNQLPFEVQIRTRKMHAQAEYGFAAHFEYAEKKAGLSDEEVSRGFAVSMEKLDWVKRLNEWQKEITDNAEFMLTVKTDLFGKRIFCFTPKGDVKDLPENATPIDFAYQIHSGLGSRVVGAKVNGKVVALDTKLKNSDVVELILSKDKSRKPNRDWLRFVVTACAKKRIKQAHKLD